MVVDVDIFGEMHIIGIGRKTSLPLKKNDEGKFAENAQARLKASVYSSSTVG